MELSGLRRRIAVNLHTLVPRGDEGIIVSNYRLKVLALTIGAAFFGAVVVAMLLRQVVISQLPPDIIQTLQNPSADSAIPEITLGETQLNETWPFTQEEYDKAVTRTLTENDARALVGILRRSASGRQQQNHPVTVRRGIVRFRYPNADTYYLLYALLRAEKDELVTLDALPRSSFNPNLGRTYENQELSDYLNENEAIMAGDETKD